MENPYCLCLPISAMKQLGLFDNISYKYIKDIIYITKNVRHDDEFAIEVVIQERFEFPEYHKTEFTFIIPQMDDESDGQEFNVIKQYKDDSLYGNLMTGLRTHRICENCSKRLDSRDYCLDCE